MLRCGYCFGVPPPPEMLNIESATVEDLPDYGVVRQPLSLTFTVRQHGVTKLNNLEPRVEARASDGATAGAVAERGKDEGQYTARLVLPEAGVWTVTIHSGFGNSQVTLEPLQVIEPGAQAPVLAAPDRGRRLFVAKGCVTCHLHRDVSGSGVVAVGPGSAGGGAAPGPVVQASKGAGAGPR